MTMKQWLSIRDLKERDGISNSTRWAWVAAGRYPRPHSLGPRCTRWWHEDIEQWNAAKRGAA
jgi:predicted DNA-binding transcriptional regulator AlpA